MRHPRYAAVIVGASHNPSGDTGQKIFGPGVQPIAQGIGPEGGLDRIKAHFLANTSPTPSGAGRGSLRTKELIEDFVNDSLALAQVKPGSLEGERVFQDYLFVAAGREMMLAFDRAGAVLEPLHFTADGSFPLGDPNPVKQAVIRTGLEALRSGQHQVGMFFDGDGDRLDIYQGDGTYLSSSFVYAAILLEIRRQSSSRGPDMRIPHGSTASSPSRPQRRSSRSGATCSPATRHVPRRSTQSASISRGTRPARSTA